MSIKTIKIFSVAFVLFLFFVVLISSVSAQENCCQYIYIGEETGHGDICFPGPYEAPCSEWGSNYRPQFMSNSICQSNGYCTGYSASTTVTNGCCQVTCPPGACGGGCYPLPCPSEPGSGLSISIVENGTCQAGFCTTADYTVDDEPSTIEFIPQVTIPTSIKIGGKSFSINKGQGIVVDGTLLNKYIALVFKWFIWAIGIVAVAYMAFGGMQWLAAAGNPQGINQAKTTIRDSLIGLLLAVSSYVVLFNINPNLVGFKGLKISEIERLRLEMTEVGIKGAKCVPVTKANSACRVEYLTSSCFGENAVKASSICNVESNGFANLPSGVDICALDGNPVSFGLFQINITAWGFPGLDCPSAFDGGPYTAKNHDCKVVNQQLYDDCIEAATTASINIRKACDISSNGVHWGQWGANGECNFPQ